MVTPAMLRALIFSAATLSASAAAGQPVADRLAGIVQTEAPRALARHDAEGVAVAIIHDGVPVWSGGFGLADRATGSRVGPQTVFEAASLTKPVTAWAILKLAEQGRIDIDAPIENYLGGWRLPPSEFDHRQVTARRILAHAAGLSAGGDPGVEPGEPVPGLTEAAAGASQEGGALAVTAAPGAAFGYSSKGYILLEMAIEQITGESYAAFTGREVLAGLGMRDSGFDWTPELEARAATGHDWYGRPLPRYEHATRAQGGLLATAADIARFVAASMQGPNGEPPGRGVLSPESVALTFTPYEFSGDSSRIGLGYNLYTGDTPVARKSGDHRGFKAILFAMPEQRTGIVILSNSDRAAAGVFADIACPWSRAVDGDPLSGVCRQLYTIRNVHIAVAAAFGAGAVAVGGLVLAGVRAGRRARVRRASRLRRAGLAGLILICGLWWGFWYTDIPLGLMGYPPTFVTVRFDPWPTGMIWVSYAVTLLIAALILAALFPKTSGKSRAA